MYSYTVNVRGNVVAMANYCRYHAYYANGITAIEIWANNKLEAVRTAHQFGTVLYAFL